MGHRVIVRWKRNLNTREWGNRSGEKKQVFFPPSSELNSTRPRFLRRIERSDHPFLNSSSIFFHLLGATLRSVVVQRVKFPRTSRDAPMKRYNSSSSSSSPDDTIFHFWFTTSSSSSSDGIASTRDKNYRTITRARGWLVRNLGSR